MKANERLQALTILSELLNNKSSLSHLLPTTSTPFTKELCFGFCRHSLRLEAIADVLIEKRPKDAQVWILILLGLYQLHYMNIADYAVVQETVAVLSRIKKTWAKGLVNAVLRSFCRDRERILAQLSQDPDFQHGHPQWFLQRLQTDWPNDWLSIVSANDAHPPMTLRVNVQEQSVEQYMQLLQEAGMQASIHPIASSAITLASPCEVTSLPGFDKGWVSVQDAAAQLAASLLDLRPGLRLLDACCAPGGKTCHILETQNDLAACLALDVDEHRLKKVSDNLQRLHLHAQIAQGDALHPESWWDGVLFDRILLDAPCSATGVIRRHSDIKLLRSNAEITAVQKIQQNMLECLWNLLAPGGLMVYATCSVMAAENEQQIARFLESHPDCQIEAMNYPWGRDTGHGRQILPGEFGMDGFFYSRLLKGNMLTRHPE